MVVVVVAFASFGSGGHSHGGGGCVFEVNIGRTVFRHWHILANRPFWTVPPESFLLGRDAGACAVANALIAIVCAPTASPDLATSAVTCAPINVGRYNKRADTLDTLPAWTLE